MAVISATSYNMYSNHGDYQDKDTRLLLVELKARAVKNRHWCKWNECHFFPKLKSRCSLHVQSPSIHEFLLFYWCEKKFQQTIWFNVKGPSPCRAATRLWTWRFILLDEREMYFPLLLPSIFYLTAVFYVILTLLYVHHTFASNTRTRVKKQSAFKGSDANKMTFQTTLKES